MSLRKPFLLAFLCLLTTAVSTTPYKIGALPWSKAGNFVGGVYVMTNNVEFNSITAYGRQANGTLQRIGSFPTGGKGAVLDEGGGIDSDDIDPLFSAYSVILTPDNRFLIAVNAGSRSISVFRIRKNFRLRLVSIRRVSGSGPVSLAFSRGIVYAASIEASRTLETDVSPFSVRGVLTGFKLFKSGRLGRLRKSVRRLPNRPAGIQFTKDGRSLVVTSLAAGSADLEPSNVDEVSVFRVLKNGLLSDAPIDTAISTLPNNEEGRSLPGAIGFETVQVDGTQYVIVAEPRFMSAEGGFGPQISSISTWRITSEQMLVPEQQDLIVGTSTEIGQDAACWLELSKTKEYFWSANTIAGTISSFSFKDGKATLLEEVAATPAVPIDLWLSSDGKFLYQLSNGAVDAYEVEDNGSGPGLTKIQTLTDIPETNVQGIVAV